MGWGGPLKSLCHDENELVMVGVYYPLITKRMKGSPHDSMKGVLRFADRLGIALCVAGAAAWFALRASEGSGPEVGRTPPRSA